MKHITPLFLFMAALIFPKFNASAQVAKTQVVQLSAIANSDGSITLNWPKETYAGNFKVYHRNFVHNNNVWSAYASETGECQLNFNDLSDQLLLIHVNQGGKTFTEKVNLTHN